MERLDHTNNNRMVLLLIAGIPLTMILAATWLWYFVAHGDLDLVGALGTANRGALVQPPRQLDDVALFEDTGARFKYEDLDPRWTLLIPGSGGNCNAGCEKSLYLTRQIHVAMGAESKRIRRLYVSESPSGKIALTVTILSDQRPAPPDFADFLALEHRGLKALTLSGVDHGKIFAEYGEDASTWYLVDPRGWVMMSYNSDIPYKEVISDLKFLLKNSAE
jgi:hypothetical protein